MQWNFNKLVVLRLVIQTIIIMNAHVVHMICTRVFVEGNWVRAVGVLTIASRLDKVSSKMNWSARSLVCVCVRVCLFARERGVYACLREREETESVCVSFSYTALTFPSLRVSVKNFGMPRIGDETYANFSDRQFLIWLRLRLRFWLRFWIWFCFSNLKGAWCFVANGLPSWHWWLLTSKTH